MDLIFYIFFIIFLYFYIVIFLYFYIVTASIPKLSLDRVTSINLIIWTIPIKATSEKKSTSSYEIYIHRKKIKSCTLGFKFHFLPVLWDRSNCDNICSYEYSCWIQCLELTQTFPTGLFLLEYKCVWANQGALCPCLKDQPFAWK